MITPSLSLPTNRKTPATPAALRDQPRRAIENQSFGIGYGNSSGYASAKRYAPSWGQARFRCA